MAKFARRAYVFGRADEATHPDSIRATLAEFLSTFVFVFVREGSIIALELYVLLDIQVVLDSAAHTGIKTPGGIILVALAHALALFAAISAAISNSGVRAHSVTI